MKKGIVGGIIGFLAMIVAFSFIPIFTDIFGFILIIPALFILSFVIIMMRVIKHAKNVENKFDSKYNDTMYGTTICKKCHSTIEKAANYCPVCGASQDDTIKCQYCGHVNPSTNALCEKCNGFL